MIIHGDSAWLMLLQNPDDAGFHSLNRSYHGPAKPLLQIQLGNGQMDEDPKKLDDQESLFSFLAPSFPLRELPDSVVFVLLISTF